MSGDGEGSGLAKAKHLDKMGWWMVMGKWEALAGGSKDSQDRNLIVFRSVAALQARIPVCSRWRRSKDSGCW